MLRLLLALALVTFSLASSLVQAEQVNIYSFRQPFLIDPKKGLFSALSAKEICHPPILF
jgi:hypothetical protein